MIVFLCSSLLHGANERGDFFGGRNWYQAKSTLIAIRIYGGESNKEIENGVSCVLDGPIFKSTWFTAHGATN